MQGAEQAMFKELSQGLAKSERDWRQLKEIERDISRLERYGKPVSPGEKLWEDVKIELSVAGHQMLLMIGIGLGYVVLFLLLLWAFPYIWDWFWSFP